MHRTCQNKNRIAKPNCLGLICGSDRILSYAVLGANAPTVLPAPGMPAIVPADHEAKPHEGTFLAAFTSRSPSYPQDRHTKSRMPKVRFVGGFAPHSEQTCDVLRGFTFRTQPPASSDLLLRIPLSGFLCVPPLLDIPCMFRSSIQNFEEWLFTSARVVSWIAPRAHPLPIFPKQVHHFATGVRSLPCAGDRLLAIPELPAVQLPLRDRRAVRECEAALHPRVDADGNAGIDGCRDFPFRHELNPDPDRGLHDPDCLELAVYVSAKAEVPNPLDMNRVPTARSRIAIGGISKDWMRPPPLNGGTPALPRPAPGERTPGTPCPADGARIAEPKPGNHRIP